MLKPRGFINPRDKPDFFCGLDKAVDAEKLLAELNSEFLFGLIDNTDDPNVEYQTSVYDVASFNAAGSVYYFPNPCSGECFGLFSLILIPPNGQCYSDIFKDANVIGKD